MLPAAGGEDDVQIGCRDGDVDPVEEFAQGDRDQWALGGRDDGVHGSHEGVDIEHQSACLGHGNGCEHDVDLVDLVEGDAVVAQVGLQPGQTVGVVDRQRELRYLAGPGLDEQITVGAFEVRRLAYGCAGD